MIARTDEGVLLRAMPLVFVLIWSTGFIVARYGMPHAPPLSFLAWRYVLSILCFLPWIVLAAALGAELGLDPWQTAAGINRIADPDRIMPAQPIRTRSRRPGLLKVCAMLIGSATPLARRKSVRRSTGPATTGATR